ncbi:MAG TPA: P-loop NTPase, partial [Thermoanaerobaculia bacterium]|nr:P-loop NTPase [Thermoanaerobaculia bacterium]
LAAGAELRFDTVGRGGEHTWRATREFALLGQLLAGVDWGEQDLLLFDLPPGAERLAQYADFLGPEAAFLLVTIPSDVARGVVARSLSALAAAGGRAIGHVENMAGYWCAECGAVRPLFPEGGGELAVPRLGRVPFDPALAALCDRGWPADEEPAGSGALAAVDAVADRLEEAWRDEPPAPADPASTRVTAPTHPSPEVRP